MLLILQTQSFKIAPLLNCKSIYREGSGYLKKPARLKGGSIFDAALTIANLFHPHLAIASAIYLVLREWYTKPKEGDSRGHSEQL